MLFRLLVSCLVVVLAAHGAIGQNAASSLWNHNNSIMALFADGSARVFKYERPRQGMRDEGVTKGTVLFDGVKSGDAYEGTAYVFDRRCGAIAYSVSGTVSSDSRRVTLTGQAPSGLDGNCQATRYRDDFLDFNFIKALTPTPEVARVPDDDAEEQARAKREERERKRAAAAERDEERLAQQREAGQKVRQERADRESSRGFAKKHVAENVCAPVIREAFAVPSKPELKDAERALMASCATCFADGVEKNFTPAERSDLDLVLSGRTSSLNPKAIKQSQEKYDRLFASCSEKLVKEIATRLSARKP